MAYDPENNPYVPGDPACYDLKWIVEKLQDLINNSDGAVTSVNGQTGDVIITFPVTSVNDQTGDVVLTIPTVPTDISAFYNDVGYITQADLPIYDGGIG